MAGELRPAHRDADAVAASQGAHDMAAEKTRAAENGNQRVVVSCVVMRSSSVRWRGASAAPRRPSAARQAAAAS